MLNFHCPECQKDFQMTRLKWLFTTAFHMFGKRKTKCPNCGKKSWLKPIK